MDNQSKIEEEVFILHRIDKLYSDSNDLDKSDWNNITTRKYRERTEMQSLEKFRRFKSIAKSLNLNLNELDLGELEGAKKEFFEFILRDRIKIRMKYKKFLSLNDKYDLFFFPECPKYLVYDTFIEFTSNIDEIETSIIEYIDFIRKSGIKKYLMFKSDIFIYCKVNNKYKYIQDFVNHVSDSEDFEIHSIRFGSDQGDESFIENISILIGKLNYYISAQNNYNDLSFYLFIKDYFKKFI